MIQRIQSLWLLLAAACSFIIMKLPYFGGTLANVYTDLTATHNFITLLLSSAVGAGALILIFLFKNRKRQMQFILLTLLVALGNIAMLHYETKEFTNGHFTVYAILVIAVPVFLALAARAVYKDEKLIKSLDRLR